MKLLLLDADQRFAAAFGAALTRQGYDVEHSCTADIVDSGRHWDMVLLGMNLPDRDGLVLCGQLAARKVSAGIIMITSRSGEADRVAGLRAGADDYIVKPFSFPELLARLDAVSRRTRQDASGVRTVGSLVLDHERYEARVAGARLCLTLKEFQLLAVLMDQAGAVVPRSRLVADVWQRRWLGSSRTLDVHIAVLRSKLAGVVRLETVRGVGYRLVPGESVAVTAGAS
ncbi:MAG: response regulator transcription factor [Micromonosporaceae bacterium]|nr:response regulator transcription factor [Micromonosporaceae bacterium]